MTVRARAQRLLEAWLAEGQVPAGQLEMLVRAGVLDAAEAGRWRRAIERADDDPPPADAALAARARAAIAALAPLDRDGARALAVALGAIGRRELVRGHLEDLAAWRDAPGASGGELVEGGWTTAVELPADLSPRERAELGLEVDPSELEEDAHGELLRVLPGPPDRRAGLRVTSIAVHERRTVVRWHAAQALDPATLDAVDDGDPWAVGEELELADDVGTAYGRLGSGGSAGGGRVSGTTVFDRPVPPRARVLRLGWGGGVSACDAVGP